MTNYPGAIDEFRNVENLPGVLYDPADTKTVYAEDTNNLASAVVAIENTLGVDPAGPAATVADRLEDSIIAHSIFAEGKLYITVPVEFISAATNSAIYTDAITVRPSEGGSSSASMFLNNGVGREYEFFCNSGGSFGVYDKTSSEQPFTIDPGSQTNTLKIHSGGMSIGKQLYMDGNKIASLATPEGDNDAANKKYVDDLIEQLKINNGLV